MNLDDLENAYNDQLAHERRGEVGDLIKDNLCSNDPRSAFYIELDDDPRPARVNCFCENCFSGKDKLAVRIAELEATIKRVKAEVRNIDETFSHPYTTSREAYQNIRSIVECLHKALGEAK